MNKILPISFVTILLLSFFNCKTHINHIAIEHLKPQDESDDFISKLKSENVDTIISYTEACSGCIKGLPSPTYIFWIKNNERFITKFDKYTNYNTIKQYGLNIDFTYEIIDSITNENLIEPTLSLSHYGVEKIFISISNKQVKYSIINFYKTKQNSLKYKIIFIDKFRSYLFSIENHKWIGLNYKYE